MFDYVSERGITEYNAVYDDEDAQYEKTFEYEASELEPVVAKPFSPQNVAVVRETTGIEIDKSYIGSCTGQNTKTCLLQLRFSKEEKSKYELKFFQLQFQFIKKQLKMD